MEGRPEGHTFLVCELDELGNEAELVGIIAGGSMVSVLRILNAALNILKQDSRFQAAYLELLDQTDVPDGTKELAQLLIDRISAK